MGAAGAIGIGASLIGNIVSGIEQSQAAGQSAAQARRNAIRSEFAAQDAEQRGAAEAAQIMSKGSQVISESRVALASSGIELDSPVAKNVVSTTRAYSALDAATARSNAAREAWGYRSEAGEYRLAAKQASKKSMLTPLVMFTGKSGGF